jgi:hypothetical protein
MDDCINQIRKKIKALRVSMIEAETLMRDQINRNKDCSVVAGDILKMRAVMSQLVAERTLLGDREPILVSSFYIPRRPAAPRSVAVRPVKRHLVPAEKRVRCRY